MDWSFFIKSIQLSVYVSELQTHSLNTFVGLIPRLLSRNFVHRDFRNQKQRLYQWSFLIFSTFYFSLFELKYLKLKFFSFFSIIPYIVFQYLRILVSFSNLLKSVFFLTKKQTPSICETFVLRLFHYQG